jgi:hypothetical protein
MLEDDIVRRVGSMAGGGMLVCYLIRPEALGVTDKSGIPDVWGASTEGERCNALRQIVALLKARTPHNAKEKVLAVSLGSDPLGNSVIVVTSLTGVEPMMM